MTTPTLTRAILLVLRDLLTTTVSNQRSFVRLNGFDEATYFTLLGELRLLGDKLSDRQLMVRTTGHIHGFDGYAMEAEKSPTWYRNNVPATHALVLISNTVTSDAQSLKDLFTVDEATLAQPNQGLPHLLTAAFQTFTLTPDALLYQKQVNTSGLAEDEVIQENECKSLPLTTLMVWYVKNFFVNSHPLTSYNP